MIIGRFKLRRGRQVLIAALLGGTLLGSAAARAQSAAAPAAKNDASDAATIIVTAKNRKEKLQDVPLSITAFDNAALQSAGITDARDVAQFTPSFNFYSGTGRSDPTALAIRGLASNTSDERYQGLSIFVDGIALSGQLVGIDLTQLERVEVIKGPQSATFGRATYSGAINYITRDPTPDSPTGYLRLSGSIAAAGTNRPGASYYGGGRFDFPIVADHLWLSVNALAKRQGALFRDPGDGSPIGEEQTLAGGATLFWRPASNLSIKTSISASSEDDSPGAVYNLHPREFTTGGGTAVALPRGPLALWPVVVPKTVLGLTGGQFVVGASPAQAGRTRSRLFASMVARYNVGDYELSYRGGYMKQTLLINDDFFYRSQIAGADPVFGPAVAAGTATLAPGASSFLSANQEKFWNTSHQLLLVSPGNLPFRWQAGAYYFYESDLNYVAPANVTATNPQAQTRGQEAIKNYAVFGGIAYDLTDQLNLNLEGRYQWENSSLAACPLCRTATPSPLIDRQKVFLPRATLQYKVTPDIMAYALFAQGQKSSRLTYDVVDLNKDGVISDSEIQLLVAKPERLDNYEVGLKNTLFGGRVVLNLAAYYQRVRQQQLLTQSQVTRSNGSIGIISVARNVGGSTIKGFEIEGSAKVSPLLTISGGIGYAHQEFTSPDPITISASSAVFFPDTRKDGTVVLQGKTQANVPDWSGNLSALLTLPETASGGRFTLRGDAIYRGKFFGDLGDISTIGSSWKFNMRATYTAGPFEFAVFGKNLGNDRTATGAFLAGGAYFCAFQENNVAVYGPKSSQRCMFLGAPRPRELGAELTVRF